MQRAESGITVIDIPAVSNQTYTFARLRAETPFIYSYQKGSYDESGRKGTFLRMMLWEGNQWRVDGVAATYILLGLGFPVSGINSRKHAMKLTPEDLEDIRRFGDAEPIQESLNIRISINVPPIRMRALAHQVWNPSNQKLHSQLNFDPDRNSGTLVLPQKESEVLQNKSSRLEVCTLY